MRRVARESSRHLTLFTEMLTLEGNENDGMSRMMLMTPCRRLIEVYGNVLGEVK
jgi:hypothetical protein